jgi:Flagellar hook-length control protein FliK
VLDKLTSVSPPQKTDLLMNHKISHQKSEKIEGLDNLAAKNLKSDFKDHLKEQFKKEQAKENKKDFKSEKNESRPGENKKKVAKKADQKSNDKESSEEKLDLKNDQAMILMNMVSDESEVKIPDFEENLAQVEESQKNLTIDLVQNLSAADQAEIMPTEMQEGSAVGQTEIQTQDELDISMQSSASTSPNAFQDKVMDALKKDRSELKLDQLKEKLASIEKNTAAINSAKQDATADIQSNAKNNDPSSDQAFTDQKSLKEDQIKNELMKADSKHVGQSEFHSQLSAQGAEHSKPAAESAIKTETANDPSVKELLNQANYLVTKGGGEVTLKMNAADGMGDVHLKVMMTNGKMNIELNTQDKSVKKLIEDSLSDLRSSLAARQISLEHVKINSVNATNTENNSGSLQNSNQQAGSESNQSKTFDQLQQQMQQQKNQNQQRGFTKTLLNEDRPVVTSIANAQKSIQKSAASQYYGLNKAQGLNAVA